MLKINDLNLYYGNTQALKNFNLCIDEGTIYSVLGPSGCGKTSLINILAGNIKHFTGELFSDGAKLNYKKQTIGLISQDYGLLPWLTVYKNIVLPLKIKKLNIRDYREKITYVMESLGISELKDRYPGSLSGGQKQRAAIASAFILDLELLLMDEPFSALDQVSREGTQELFFRVWKKSRPTTLFATHSVEEAVFLGQKIVILSNAPGSVLDIANNPTFGHSEVRLSREYSDFCLDIRRLIKDKWTSGEV